MLKIYYLRTQSIYPSRRLRCVRAHASSHGVVVEYMDRARGNTGRLFTQTSRGTHTNTAKVTYFSYGGTYRDEHSASFMRVELLDRWRLIAVVAATVSATCGTVKGLQGTDPQRAHKPPPCIAPLTRLFRRVQSTSPSSERSTMTKQTTVSHACMRVH